MKNKFNDDEGGDCGESGDVDDCEDYDDDDVHTWELGAKVDGELIFLMSSATTSKKLEMPPRKTEEGNRRRKNKIEMTAIRRLFPTPQTHSWLSMVGNVRLWGWSNLQKAGQAGNIDFPRIFGEVGRKMVRGEEVTISGSIRSPFKSPQWLKGRDVHQGLQNTSPALFPARKTEKPIKLENPHHHHGLLLVTAGKGVRA